MGIGRRIAPLERPHLRCLEAPLYRGARNSLRTVDEFRHGWLALGKTPDITARIHPRIDAESLPHSVCVLSFVTIADGEIVLDEAVRFPVLDFPYESIARMFRAWTV